MKDFPAFLKTVSIFSTLTDPDLQRIAGEFKLLEFEPGTQIVREGEASDSLFVVKEGFVNVMRISKGDKNTFIALLTVKDYFGEAALFDGIHRTASVIAVEKVQLLAITKAQLHLFLQSNAGASNRILFEMLKQVFMRLSSTSRDLQDVRSSELNQTAIDKLFI